MQRPGRNTLVFVFLVVTALPGCIQDSDSTETVPGRPGGAAAVHGWVFDASLRPVEGAQVTLGAAGTTTNGDGWYRIPAPERPSVLRVQAEGYDPVTQFVSPDYPGQQITLNLTLQTRPSLQPWSDVLRFNGLVTCGAMAEMGHSHDPNRPHEHNDIDCGAEAPGDQTVWVVPIPATAMGLVLEVFWESDHALAEWMTVWAYALRDGQEPELIAYQEMPNPLRLQLASQRVQWLAQQDADLLLDFRVGTGTDITDEAIAIAVMVRQEFEAFASIFHVEPPHPEYTVAEATG